MIYCSVAADRRWVSLSNKFFIKVCLSVTQVEFHFISLHMHASSIFYSGKS